MSPVPSREPSSITYTVPTPAKARSVASTTAPIVAAASKAGMMAATADDGGRLEEETEQATLTKADLPQFPVGIRAGKLLAKVEELDLDALDPAVVEIIARRAKAELRKRARGVRKSSPKVGIQARSQQIVTRLLAMPAVVGAKHVAVFDAIAGRNEVELVTFGQALRERGVRTYYPAIDPETRNMVFRDPGDPESMQEYGFGFREPDPAIPAAEKLDVVIVPALRADGRGHRLGYGAGYYDRALPVYCPPATSIIVVFDFELAPELPLTPGDFPCDWVVTDKRSIQVSDAPL